MATRGAGGGAALRQRARGADRRRAAAGGGGSTAEIELAVRIRPGAASVVDVGGTGAVDVGGESFTYQSSVVRGSDQVVAFDALASRLVRRAQEGYSCTLMAYGQTGSGKTHTMFGPPGCLTEASVAASGGSIPDDWGLFPRSVLTLMHAPGIDPRSVYASAVEVYHENVFDLLDDRNQLAVGTTTKMGNKVGGAAEGAGGAKGVGVLSTNGVHPNSCTCRKCFKAQEEAKEAAKAARQAKIAAARSGGGANATVGARAAARAGPNPETFATVGEKLLQLREPEDVARFARTIEATRTAKSHALNDRSSRSHCLVKIHLVRKTASGQTKITLLFVDLAGSERTKKTGVEGAAKAEALSINGSLSALGRVIKALGGRQGDHVPYRDAPLTMLLRDSFGGKSCTSVVINVASEPEHAEETICSLRFGERMVVVRNAPTVVVNSVADTARSVQAAQRALAIARVELARLEADGQGSGFAVGCAVHEKKMLQANMDALDEQDQVVKSCVAEIAEERTRGASTKELEARLALASEKAENLRANVWRQQTIKGLWTQPTPAYTRKLGEVKELESQTTLLVGK